MGSDSCSRGGTVLSAARTLELAACAILVVDAGTGVIAEANPHAGALFAQHHAGLAGASITALFPDWCKEAHTVGTRSDGGSPLTVHLRGQQLGGRSFTAEVSISRSGAESLVVTVREAQQCGGGSSELQNLVSLLNATLESTADGLLVVGTDGRISGINAKFADMWGIPAAVLATHDDEAVMDLVVGQLSDPDAFLAKVREVYSRPSAESLDVLEFKDGRVFERFSRPQMIGDRVVGRVWSFRDITSKRLAESRAERAMAALARRAEELRKLAFTDPLTGLGNRALFNDVLEQARRDPSAAPLSLLLLDLDDFKEVNDVHGHESGDRLLIAVSRRLRRCVGAGNIVARIGGDEFVVVVRSGDDPEAVARQVIELSRVPVDVGGGVKLFPSLSMGIAPAEGDCTGPDTGAELLRRADIAMYAAKAAGKNRFVRFHPDMMVKLMERAELQDSLRSALSAGSVLPVYQPVVSKSGEIVQLEALARWERDGQMVPAAVFISEAESSGLIRELGATILGAVCAETAEWLKGRLQCSIAVNVSGLELRDPEYADSVLRTLARHGISPLQLVLEVTESVFLGDECAVIRQLTTLRHHGVRISVDDFGTGYSSFGRLHQLPVDAVKLDKSFIQLITNPNDRSPIVMSMIDMAHNLGLTVTAEGIETPAQADYVRSLGCDFQQGYLHARPMPIATLYPLLGLADNRAR